MRVQTVLTLAAMLCSSAWAAPIDITADILERNPLPDPFPAELCYVNSKNKREPIPGCIKKREPEPEPAELCYVNSKREPVPGCIKKREASPEPSPAELCYVNSKNKREPVPGCIKM